MLISARVVLAGTNFQNWRRETRRSGKRRPASSRTRKTTRDGEALAGGIVALRMRMEPRLIFGIHFGNEETMRTGIGKRLRKNSRSCAARSLAASIYPTSRILVVHAQRFDFPALVTLGCRCAGFTFGEGGVLRACACALDGVGGADQVLGPRVKGWGCMVYGLSRVQGSGCRDSVLGLIGGS